MGILLHRIRMFWNEQPCGTHLVDLPPGSLEYFVEFDRAYAAMYPYLLPFVNLESLRSKRVLEIGLGSGYLLQQISGVTPYCYGLDLSEGTVQLNKSRVRELGANVHLIHGSATDIPLADNSLDAVISIGCLHHIPRIDRAVAEIHRVLKPGGIVKCMVYNRHSYRYKVYIPVQRRLGRRWRGKSTQECVNEMYDGVGNPYGTVYSKGEITRLFRGFDIVSFEQQNFVGGELVPWLGDRVPRAFWLATLGRIMGLDLYFTARVRK